MDIIELVLWSMRFGLLALLPLCALMLAAAMRGAQSFTVQAITIKE